MFDIVLFLSVPLPSLLKMEQLLPWILNQKAPNSELIFMGDFNAEPDEVRLPRVAVRSPSRLISPSQGRF